MSKASRAANKQKRQQKRSDRKNKRKSKAAERKQKMKWALLVPFKPVMLKALKKKGFDLKGKKISEIATRFKEIVINKKNNFETDVSMFETDAEEQHIIAEAASGIIKGILEFIKGLFKKKEQGAELSETEREIVEGAEKVSATIDEGKKEVVSDSVGEIVTKYWWLILIALVAIFLIMRKF